jgi:polysaccharide deacetylase 2 family uncharacterized protein YibQ
LLAAAGSIGGGAWVVSIPHELAGEPVILVAVPPVEDIKTATIEPAAIPEDDQPAAEEKIVQPQSDNFHEETTIIVSARRPLKAAPISAVSEATADGSLPRISSNGKKPFDVYAQITPMGILNSDRPKIAIVLGGMGLNAGLTKKAIKELPGDITFGFAPYGENLQDQVNRARAQGHEILLQLPMEPLGYPANNPGPNTLLAEDPEAGNLKSLRWHMSRFAGYSGITNYMGGRFLATPATLRPVLAELKARGLVFLEDAAIPVSSVEDVGKVTGLRTRHSDVAIDATADAASIEAALAQLEELARANGFAVGTGSGLEITIDTVAEWAKELEEKGIVLVPVSAVYKGRMS